jgi:predicted nuclease of predicted toxin-antitoxin system
MQFDHVLTVSPELGRPTSDHQIWKFAKNFNYHIVTRDEDFIKLSMLFGLPPKVIYVNSGNITNQEFSGVLMKNEQKIKRFIEDEEYGFLVIN